MPVPALPDPASLRRAVHPLDGSSADYAPLIALAADVQVVCLGEASHGTHEFYAERARITRRLVEELGFNAVAVEADWPDAERVSRWVLGESAAATADEALAGFERFPQWMWRNTDVVALVEWLREHNRPLPRERRCGFHGIDLYSLHASAGAVLAYLREVDPEAARRARERYACFDHYGDPQAYGYLAGHAGDRSCEDAVVRQLVELRQRAGELAMRDGRAAADAFFSAEQNARLVRNAEQYYRAMFRGRVSSWNLRDQHMAETVDALAAHLRRQGQAPRIVVWAHNSHLGDARATEMGTQGELNVGQLVRQRHGDRAVLVGFTTHTGTVTAASDWDAPAERKRVRPALAGSWERLFHDVGVPRFLLALRGTDLLDGASLLERAIGVIYRPETERQSHYFHATLARQFDAVVHIDQTRAVTPLEPGSGWTTDADEYPETYPSAL
jgi:erythromycin esterase-like protein